MDVDIIPRLRLARNTGIGASGATLVDGVSEQQLVPSKRI